MSSGILLTSIARVSDEETRQGGIPVASLPPPMGTSAATPRVAPTAPDAAVGMSAGDHAAALVAASTSPAAIDTTLDPRSTANIATLLPAAQRAARLLLATVNDGRLGPGIMVKVICGTRTYAEQTALYNQGRITPGPIVSNAPAGYSNHNFGIAFDVGIFNGGVYLADSPLYWEVGAVGRSQGLEWGGDFRDFPDEPHFQLPYPGTLAEARAMVATGVWQKHWA